MLHMAWLLILSNYLGNHRSSSLNTWDKKKIYKDMDFNLNVHTKKKKKSKSFERTLASMPPRPTLDFVPKAMDCWSPE